MDLYQIQIFLDVVELRSFAAVARKREIDPSSVSRLIAGLEDELGTRLFQRTTRSLNLTDEGQRFAPRMFSLVEEWCLASEELKGGRVEPEGRLRLTCSVAYGYQRIIPLLPKFQAMYPKVELDIIMTDANIDLIAEGVDLAIRLAPNLDSSLVGRRLHATRYFVVASPEYLDACVPINSPTELEHQECLRYAIPNLKPIWIFRHEENEQKVAVKGRLAMSNPLAIRESARRGMGVALLANWLVVDDIVSGRLVRLLKDYEATTTTFDTAAWVLYPSRRYVPEKVRCLISFLKDQFNSE